MFRYLKPNGFMLISIGCDLIHPPDQCHPLKVHPQCITSLMAVLGMKICWQSANAIPGWDGKRVVYTNTCSGGQVFHWLAQKQA